MEKFYDIVGKDYFTERTDIVGDHEFSSISEFRSNAEIVLYSFQA